MQQTAFSLFDPATGRVTLTGFCPLGDEAYQVEPGLSLYLGKLDPETQYLAGGDTITVRPEHPAPGASSVAVGAPLEGFPSGFPAAVVSPGGTAMEVTLPADGTLIFKTPGLWVVHVLEGWGMTPPRPHRPKTFEIEVT